MKHGEGRPIGGQPFWRESNSSWPRAECARAGLRMHMQTGEEQTSAQMFKQRCSRVFKSSKREESSAAQDESLTRAWRNRKLSDEEGQSHFTCFNRCSGGSPQVFEESDQVFQKKCKAKCSSKSSRKSSRKMRETRLMTKAQEKCSGVGVRLWQGGKSSKRGKSQASVRVTRAGRNRASFQRLGGSIKFYLFW